jgi:mRNA interferase RelE/StbE
MTYKLLRHKDFTAEWEKLPVAIRDQFKKCISPRKNGHLTC